MAKDLKIATGLPQQKEIMFFVRVILSLVFDQRMSLRSTVKILTILDFLKKYFICKDYSQLKLARNLFYVSLPVE